MKTAAVVHGAFLALVIALVAHHAGYWRDYLAGPSPLTPELARTAREGAFVRLHASAEPQLALRHDHVSRGGAPNGRTSFYHRAALGDALVLVRSSAERLPAPIDGSLGPVTAWDRDRLKAAGSAEVERYVALVDTADFRLPGHLCLLFGLPATLGSAWVLKRALTGGTLRKS